MHIFKHSGAVFLKVNFNNAGFAWYLLLEAQLHTIDCIKLEFSVNSSQPSNIWTF